MIKAVVFDLDDTLISERQYIESGFQYVSELISKRIHIDKQLIFDILIKLFNDDPKNVFNRLFDKLNIPYNEDNIIEMVEAYRNHEPQIQFFDDVFPCIELLRMKKIKTGIITDGYISTQRNKLRALNAEKYFDKIIITDEIGREYWKPHPRAFELMRDALNVEFSEMVYVGDNPEKDFYISRIYPIIAVRICREGIYRNRRYYKDVKQDYIIHSLMDIVELFKI